MNQLTLQLLSALTKRHPIPHTGLTLPLQQLHWEYLEETVPSLDTTTILASLSALESPDGNSTSVSTSKIINISTNGYSEAGAQKMSAGFIISGTENLKVYIKAEKSQEAGITPLIQSKIAGLEYLEDIDAL